MKAFITAVEKLTNLLIRNFVLFDQRKWLYAATQTAVL